MGLIINDVSDNCFGLRLSAVSRGGKESERGGASTGALLLRSAIERGILRSSWPLPTREEKNHLGDLGLIIVGEWLAEKKRLENPFWALARGERAAT